MMVERTRSKRRLAALVLPGVTAVLLTGTMLFGHAQRSQGAPLGAPITWGNNAAGQLGDNTLTSRADPEAVTGVTDAVQVAGGGQHSLALTLDGTVWAWGKNDRGQLGDNATIDRLTPIEVQNLQEVIAVAAGGQHSLALRADGSVWAWGDDSYGQLGDGATASTPPVAAEELRAQPVPGLSHIIQISAGENFSMALSQDGTVYTWGDGSAGQLGSSAQVSFVPQPVASVDGADAGPITEIAAGERHALALRDDGSILAWGADEAGQLGNPDGVDPDCSCRPFPAPVLDPAGNPLAAMSEIAGGGQHSLAIRYSDGAVLAWGDNSDGQLGDGTTTGREVPQPVIGLTGAVQLAAGDHHSLALGAISFIDPQTNKQTVSTIVYGWGLNDSGQAGSHSFDDPACQCRKLVDTVTGNNFPSDPLLNVTDIAAGDVHSLAIDGAAAAQLTYRLSKTGTIPNAGASTGCATPGMCPPPCTSGCDLTGTPTATATPCVTPSGGAAPLPCTPTPSPTPSSPTPTPVPTCTPTPTPVVPNIQAYFSASQTQPCAPAPCANGAQPAINPLTGQPACPPIPGIQPNGPCVNGCTPTVAPSPPTMQSPPPTVAPPSLTVQTPPPTVCVPNPRTGRGC